MTNSCHGMHPASRAFLLFAWFRRIQERLCMNRVRSLLGMRGMLIGYSFEPRPNSCAIATACLFMTIGLSINGYSHSKTQLTSPGVWAAATSKVWHDSGRACFSPAQSRQKEAEITLWNEHEYITAWIFYNQWIFSVYFGKSLRWYSLACEGQTYYRLWLLHKKKRETELLAHATGREHAR